MNAIRVRRRLDSRILDLPELEPMVGKIVEIIVLEDQEQDRVAAAAAAPPRDMSALDAIAGRDLIDVEAFERLREISKV